MTWRTQRSPCAMCRKAFPGVRALQNVSLDVAPGEVHGTGRGQRRRQIDLDPHPVGCARARQRRDQRRRPADHSRSRAATARRGCRRDLSGTEHRSGDVGAVERVPWCAAAPWPVPGPTCHAVPLRRACRAHRRHVPGQCQGGRAVGRQQATHRDHAGGPGAPQRPDHGRTDRSARSSRARTTVRLGRPAAGGRHRHHLHFP